MDKIINDVKGFALKCTPEEVHGTRLSEGERCAIFAAIVVLMCVLSVCTFKAAIALFSTSSLIKAFINSCIMSCSFVSFALALGFLIVSSSFNDKTSRTAANPAASQEENKATVQNNNTDQDGPNLYDIPPVLTHENND